MSRKEWIKTILTAAAAIFFIWFSGEKNSLYNWIEALIYTGILLSSWFFYIYGAIAGGVAGGFLRWYLLKGNMVQILALTVGGIFSAILKRFGKSTAAVAFIAGTSIIYYVAKNPIPLKSYDEIFIAALVFLLIVPEKNKPVNKFNKMGESKKQTAKKVVSRGRPVSKFECINQSLLKLSDELATVVNYFDDQSLEILFDMEQEISAAEWKQRFWESRQALRLGFFHISKLIEKEAERLLKIKDITSEFENSIKLSLKQKGITVSQIQIVEDENKRHEIFLRAVCKKKKNVSSREAAEKIHTSEARKFSPSYDCPAFIGSHENILHFTEKVNFQILYGIAFKDKEENGYCGDSFSARTIREDKMLLCLSDGMGTGKTAHQESSMAIELLEQLLENGFSLMTAVLMVNNTLLNLRDVQTPTTLDACVIDLYSGEGCFCKMGATASYLKRGKNVSAIIGKTVPVGMFSLETIEEEMLPKEKLENGDILVMMTDGVIEKAGLASDEIFKELIAGCKGNNAQEMADYIMEQVMKLEDTVNDDMTILVAGVWKK